MVLDQVAFHDLHVVDIVEQLDPRAVDRWQTATPQAEWSHW